MKSNRKPFPQAITFFLLLTINVLSAFIYNCYDEGWPELTRRIASIIINGVGVTMVIVLALFYVRKYLHVNLTAIAFGITLLILTIECFLLINYYTLISPSIVMATIETNGQEASEFLKSYLNVSTCVLLLFIAIAVYLCFHYRQKLNSIAFPVWCTQRRFLVPFCCTVLLVYVVYIYSAVNIRKAPSLPNTITGIERTYSSVKSTLKDRKEYKEYLQLVKESTPPTLTDNQSKIPYIVLVLGEALTKHHMNAYGYPLPTTPNLNKRIANGEMEKFTHIESPIAFTILALRQILTFYEDSCSLPWYKYHTLPSVMSQAGYKTYWLSNQESFASGSEENSNAAIAYTSTVVEYTHQSKFLDDKYGNFDGKLLTMLDGKMKELPSKAFFCLHLMGSHVRYNHRYPSEFDKFSIGDIDKEISAGKKQLIAEYDNSVFYNDYVVNEIIKRFEDLESIVFYFPDHGEEVYDTRDMNGHLMDNPTKGMMEVPFLIWTSESFRKEHPGLSEQIHHSVDKPFCTTNFIHTVMDICGIRTEGFCAEKSLLYDIGSKH